MMECGQLYVNRRRAFKDRKERYLPFSWPGFMMPVGKNIPPQPDRTKYWKSVKDEYSKWANYPTVCWTLSPQESYLMWKGYTDGIGVCIVSSIRKFVTSIRDSASFNRARCAVHCGHMIYNGYLSLETESLPFWKGKEYVSENELRFYFEIADDNLESEHIYIPIEYSVLIERIILTPFLQYKASKALAEMLQDKYGINVKTSKIDIK